MGDEKNIRVHSIETLGLVDGPGIRTVIFLSGCPLSCIFCHNPDSQDPSSGKLMSIEDLVFKAKRMKPYYKDKGGVTLSGGEPLLHGEGLLSLILALKKEKIHVAVDTSGVGDRAYYEEIAEAADLFLLDIKHFEKDKFRKITGGSIESLLAFMEVLKKTGTPVWIRHVMMEGFSDNFESMEGLVDFIGPIKNHVEKIEILPYHTLGVEKYKKLKRPYPLEGMAPFDPERARAFEDFANDLLEKSKNFPG